MKRLILFFLFFLPCYTFAQFNETFSDGDFTQNPEWTGSSQAFTVNADFQLQSCASATSVSYLTTQSNAFVNATWECSIKINYTTSSSNYACFYIASDSKDILNDANGYYVQIGGTNDEVSLYVIQGGKKTKIIDGTDKRTDGNPVDIKIKVTRDEKGNFTLFSKNSSEQDYYKEGSVNNLQIMKSDYIALLYSNTTTTGKAYFFDDISVSGQKATDTTPPTWLNLNIKTPNQMILTFDEAVDIKNATFSCNNTLGQPYDVEISENKKTVILTFNDDFLKGTIYELTIEGLTDIDGNGLVENKKATAVTEKPDKGDLALNEIMFNAAENSAEYIELINLTGKVLDVSGLKITTRKSSGTLNNGTIIAEESYIEPNSYLALTANADLIREHYQCPAEAKIINLSSWDNLNNETADVVICSPTNDKIFDEVIYSETWHNKMITNPQGVSLERIYPFLPSNESSSWHSASSETNFGTPGYKNSQYRDIFDDSTSKKYVWTDPEAFSPDNDGNMDQCLIHYKTPVNGYTANAFILNASGITLKHFFNNCLLSSEGIIIWDGTGDSGNTVQPGIYVLYFEMINTSTGDQQIYKLPVVVSFR